MHKKLIGIVLFFLSGMSPLWAQAIMRSVGDGVYSAEQAARGKALFASKCAGCHGTDLNGNETAPALAGSQFLGDWVGQSVGDLASRIHTTMPASNPGSLNNHQVADLIAFLLGANGFPAGVPEIPPDPTLSQQITIDAHKPAP